jgi:hypothetical protein
VIRHGPMQKLSLSHSKITISLQNGQVARERRNAADNVPRSVWRSCRFKECRSHTCHFTYAKLFFPRLMVVHFGDRLSPTVFLGPTGIGVGSNMACKLWRLFRGPGRYQCFVPGLDQAPQPLKLVSKCRQVTFASVKRYHERGSPLFAIY